MPTPHLNIEIGKLMATVAALQNQLTDIKKEINILADQVSTLREELSNFIGTVQTKNTCQLIHEKLKNEYVSKLEILPLKTLAKTVCITAATAICLALMNLILK